MNEAMVLVLAALSGLALGAFFFGGLWWTVNRSMVSAQPALLILGSFLLRSVVAVGGFYLALQGGWPSLLACMGGFLVSRALLTRIIGKHPPKTTIDSLRVSS